MSDTTAFANRTAEIVNPLIANTLNTFSMMAGVELKRTDLQRLDRTSPLHDVTAIVQMSGNPRGFICLSIERRWERWRGQPRWER